MPADLKNPFDPSCCDGGQCSTGQSARSCGCDPGAGWVCQWHKDMGSPSLTSPWWPLVQKEVSWAVCHYPRFNSAHEAYAVLLEEVDELWDEIKRSPAKRDMEALQKEAVQVAAMAVRLLTDVCGEPR